jgi:uncharacterized protein YbjT (DUF2867 family)
MAKKTYAIMGATGHIGTVLSEALLKKGNGVHAIGRDRAKLKKLEEKGAKTFSGAHDDAALLSKAFAGADAVFSLLPPGYTEEDYEAFQDKVGEAIKQALSKSNIQYVLNLSSYGAHLASGTGPVKGLNRHEKRLNAMPKINVLHMRPGFFMENLFFHIPQIKNSGIMGSTLKADLPLHMIATKDIGLKAAELLHALNFSGQSIFEQSGPRDVTMEEATAIIGKAIGNSDLEYIQFKDAEAEKGMLAAGMKPKFVKQMLEMNRSHNEGKFEYTQRLTSDNKGKTTIEEFVKTTLAPALMATAHH